jgi:hypothetical protein
MYLLFEHHRDADRKVIATDMMLSSNYPGKLGISFRDPQESAILKFFTNKTGGLFKQPHPKLRTYDEKTFVWSFFGETGKDVYDAIRAADILRLMGLKFQRVSDLATQAAAGYVATPSVAEVFDPNNFFYDPTPSGVSGPTDLERFNLLMDELSTLFNIPKAELTQERKRDDAYKRIYRKLSMAYHPDRNSGDASRMTHLNYLWQTYQKGSLL